MNGYLEKFIEKAKNNTNYREVLLTSKYTQAVIMNLLPEEEIGEEIHIESDQTLLFIQGEGDAVIEGEQMPFKEGDLFLVNAGTKHNFINTGDIDLKIITFYSPPHHPQGTIHKTKTDEKNEEY